MLTGDAKKKYQKYYMRKRRGSNKKDEEGLTKPEGLTEGVTPQMALPIPRPMNDRLLAANKKSKKWSRLTE